MNDQTFTIKGMHCDACTKLTSKRIASIDGVSDVSVELTSGLVSIVADRPLAVEEINSVLKDSGYRAEEYHD